MNWSYPERRVLALALAEHHFGPDRPPIPGPGKCIGRVFIRPVTLHLPGWSKALTLYGLVPRSLGGIPHQLPSWDSLQAHFRRREKKQDRAHFKRA